MDRCYCTYSAAMSHRSRQWLAMQRLAFGAALAGFVLPRARRRLSLPPAVTSVVAWQTPLSVAMVLPPSRVFSSFVSHEIRRHCK